MLFQSVLGLLVFTGIAWLISENRKTVRYTSALTGIGVQISIAAVLLYVPFFRKIFLQKKFPSRHSKSRNPNPRPSRRNPSQ